MSQTKTIKRLVACFGSIQLVTALSVLSYRVKEQQELNYSYEDYLVITPLFAPQGQNEEFSAFIEKMANSIYSWKKIVYLSLEQTKFLTDQTNSSSLAEVAKLVHDLVGVESPDEIYLARTWNPENQLLMNVYESAEKICYGDGIGIYFSHVAFLPQNASQEAVSLSSLYQNFKKQIKGVLPKKKKFCKQEFDIGYFSLPYAFGEVPPMETVVLDRSVYLRTFQTLRKGLNDLIDADYIKNLKANLQNHSVSILLSSNFSEAHRMPIEKEVKAYREFLLKKGIPPNSILLIKPHPRDSKQKILQLQSELNDLYAKVILLNEDFLFYLPFEVLFMELFLKFDLTQSQTPRIFTFSSACLTLEFLFDAECVVGFGRDIVEKYFYTEHIEGRIKHEVDLQSTISEVRDLIAV
ncbi:polysialyltransferase family glycosyltransferase [Gloeocapsopsis dulcis]|uniref:Uncharacterized protein n=1 Tax=Gloeocapsopsis dulcis AAB1 = 1H9 TaxID=1433147 RepID=A0A6N8FZ27_9CHRO|nr:polysialyltransferase family glycosyltransferase [Gloeocapsopsis dulcis]MUL38109.1 hypothetical protein [Gloeocapsopsis dulcis AAB1 = 1H9]WNN89372.1 polysialyltransferase family glycosyltransferase [Gloeocapsopsis dulcis]